MANEEDARDIAQESLTRLLRYRETEPASSWKPLLYRIATNVMGEQFRRASARQATRHVPLEGMEIESGAPAPEDLIEQQKHEAILRDAILAMPTRCRQEYMPSRKEGLSDKQIANRHGISWQPVDKQSTKELPLPCQPGYGASDAWE